MRWISLWIQLPSYFVCVVKIFINSFARKNLISYHWITDRPQHNHCEPTERWVGGLGQASSCVCGQQPVIQGLCSWGLASGQPGRWGWPGHVCLIPWQAAWVCSGGQRSKTVGASKAPGGVVSPPWSVDQNKAQGPARFKGWESELNLFFFFFLIEAVT